MLVKGAAALSDMHIRMFKMNSSHDDVMEIFSASPALCERNPPVTGHKGKWRGASKFFLWSGAEQTVEQTIGAHVIWDANAHFMTSL